MLLTRNSKFSPPYRFFLGIGLIISLSVSSCKQETEILEKTPAPTGSGKKAFNPTPYEWKLPLGWSLPVLPVDNPMTVEGVALGRKLFYDPILSANNSMACATCHNQALAFSDNGKQFSKGIDGVEGNRNAPALFNLAWAEQFADELGAKPLAFFWDGGASNLESQVIGPITNPIEMHDSLFLVVQKLQMHPEYPGLFRGAFGTDSITTKLLMQAIAQFERTFISGNSKFDKYMVTQDQNVFTAQEWRGFQVFADPDRGDCLHCHTAGTFTTDFKMKHNGHQSPDEGLARITGLPDDKGKFKTASLRNLVFTAPYMHDGRLNTLEEVVDFYDHLAIRTYPADNNIRKHEKGLQLSSKEKGDLVAFLKTMTDSSFITNPAYSKP